MEKTTLQWIVDIAFAAAMVLPFLVLSILCVGSIP